MYQQMDPAFVGLIVSCFNTNSAHVSHGGLQWPTPFRTTRTLTRQAGEPEEGQLCKGVTRRLLRVSYRLVSPHVQVGRVEVTCFQSPTDLSVR